MPYNIDIRGWMAMSELQIIERWAKEIPENGSMVELGSMLGRSAYAWAASAHPSVTITCMDAWGGSSLYHPQATAQNPREDDTNTMEAFLENLKEFPNVRAVKVIMPDFPKEVLQPVDLVFLDAAHWNPVDWGCIQQWLMYIKPGGWLCGHDYCPTTIPDPWPDITTNILRLEAILGKKVEVPVSDVWSSLWRFQV